MTDHPRRTLTIAGALGLGIALGATAIPTLAVDRTAASAPAPASETSTSGKTVSETPLSDAIRAAPKEVQEFNEHLTILASPWMGGRLPGSIGMDYATAYVEHYYELAGLEKPYLDEDGNPSYLQRFSLGSNTEMVDQAMSITAGGRTIDFTLDSDFVMTGLGEGGGVSGPLAFVGYSIDNENESYATFGEDDDLSGHIAVVFRFEPMEVDGSSRWADRGWSPYASFSHKFSTLAERNPAGVILVNPPGSSDPRANEFMTRSQRMMQGVPVFMATPEAAEKLLAVASGENRSITKWRELADEGEIGVEVFDDATVTLSGRVERQPVYGENVIGMLPGRGKLAEEYIVIGGHLDHLGMGAFGSRSGENALHPGADDNASGSAAIIMLARQLSDAYAEKSDDADLRSILFMCFSGEESGLNGSRHYVRNPLVSASQHTLMINFDMIGRITNDRLSVSGANTAEGLAEFAAPFFASSGLEIVQPEGISGASDHTPFLQANIPILFGIIADFHDDYHTPRDTSDKINREGAVKTVNLFREIALAAAERPDGFTFKTPNSGRARSMPRVSLGVRSTVDEGEPGLRVIQVTEDSSADEAGIKAGDRLIKWNKVELEDRRALIEALREHDPGDTIQAVLLRDGEEVTVYVELKARG